MEPIILDSARKHGVADDDMLHAFRNPIRFIEQDDLTMIIGTGSNGALLEIGIVTATDFEGFLIVHAMPARSKYI